MGEKDAFPPVKLTGIGASKGVAVGPVYVHACRESKPERESISEAELECFQGAVEAVATKLSEIRDRLGESTEAAIFDAHVEMARDPELEERVRNLESPEAAVLAVGEEGPGELPRHPGLRTHGPGGALDVLAPRRRHLSGGVIWSGSC